MGGVRCESLSSVYQEKVIKTTKLDKEDAKDPQKMKSIGESEAIVKSMAGAVENRPVRIPPKIIRIWVAPWEDADGDLHGEPELIYSEVNDKRGRWLYGEKDVSASSRAVMPQDEEEDVSVVNDVNDVNDAKGKKVGKETPGSESKPDRDKKEIVPIPGQIKGKDPKTF